MTKIIDLCAFLGDFHLKFLFHVSILLRDLLQAKLKILDLSDIYFPVSLQSVVPFFKFPWFLFIVKVLLFNPGYLIVCQWSVQSHHIWACLLNKVRYKLSVTCKLTVVNLTGIENCTWLSEKRISFNWAIWCTAGNPVVHSLLLPNFLH